MCAQKNGAQVFCFGRQVNDRKVKNAIKILDYSNSTVKIQIAEKKFEYKMPNYGFHFVINSVCVISVLCALDLEFDSALLSDVFSKFQPDCGRGIQYNLKKADVNFTVIDDSYNASYESISALSNYVINKKQKKIIILGYLAELGDCESTLYKKIAKKIEFFDLVITVGIEANAISDLPCGKVKKFSSVDHLIKNIDDLYACFDSDCIVAVKGSRKSCLDKIVDFLKNDCVFVL